MKRSLPLLLALSLTSLVSCSSNGEAITGLAFTQTSYSLTVGDAIELRLVFMGGKREAQFLSTNESVATVDKGGKVTAVGIGEAVIVAFASDYIARCAISVDAEGISTVPVYEQKGILAIDANAPALGLVGKTDMALDYVYQDGDNSMRYFDYSLPKGEFLNTISNYKQAPLFAKNPTLDLPDMAKDTLEKAALVQQGPFVSKTLYKDLAAKTYLYDKDSVLGVLDFDAISALSSFQFVQDLLDGITNIHEAKDVLDLFLKLFTKQRAEDFLKFIKLFIGVIKGMDFDISSVDADERSFDFTFDAATGKAVFGYCEDIDFGENPELTSASIRFVQAKKDKRDYAFKELAFGFEAKLFGETNKFSISYRHDGEKTAKPADFFRAMEKELAGA